MIRPLTSGASTHGSGGQPSMREVGSEAVSAESQGVGGGMSEGKRKSGRESEERRGEGRGERGERKGKVEGDVVRYDDR